jgi:hypothetical protein
MRIFPILIGLAMVSPLAAGQSTHVDGILVYGRVHDISVGDIREATAASVSRKPVALEVLSSTEIHVYPSWDLGWRPVCYCEVNEPDGSRHREWMADGWGIPGMPGVFGFIKAADAVFVFPESTPLDPHRDDRHLRLLDPEARRNLVRVLGHEENWLHGFDNRFRVGGKEPANVGFLFRHGSSELVLFLASGDSMQGTFKGENTGGSLLVKAGQELETWKRRYAQPELTVK